MTANSASTEPTTSTKYRADHVGSLLRPPELVKARWAYYDGKVTAEEFSRLADEAIPRALQMQKDAGVGVFTDGEYRRTWWAGSLAEAIEGLVPNPDGPAEGAGGGSGNWRLYRTGELAPPEVQEDARKILVPYREFVVGDRMKLKHRIAGEEAQFMKQHSPGRWKITIAGLNMTASWFKPGITDRFYASEDELLQELIGFINQEMKALIQDGCSYIQLDSLRYTGLMDPRRRQVLIDSGKDLQKELEHGIEIDNACLAGLRGTPGVTVGHHICRGNNRGSYGSVGGYEPVAEALFNTLNVDRFLLEYDDARSGGFEPLRFVPRDKMVVLGLVTTKDPEMESEDELLRRIDEAAKYVPIENLAISPQCGFASAVTGQPLTWEQQQQKLELVAKVARKVWG
jgi:5-methyltetrahydropteroyltriglutamate--homocysteine methyltransferase